MKQYSKSEFKTHISSILKETQKTGEPVFITEHHFPVFELILVKPRKLVSDVFADQAGQFKQKPDCFKYDPKEWGNMAL